MKRIFTVLLVAMLFLGILLSSVGCDLSDSKPYADKVHKDYTNKENDEEWVDDGATMGEKNALASAINYLDFMSFSKKGLRKQLNFEGYSENEIQYALDHCKADWNEQAVKSARSYLSTMSFSRKELAAQLEFDGYTSSEINYALNKVYN